MKHKRLKEMQSELTQKELTFSAIANTFHDIRTPLHSLQGFIKLMLDDKVSDTTTQKEFLLLADEQSQYLSSLIMNILDIAAIESGQTPIERQSVSMKEVIDKATGKLQKFAEKKDIVIETNFPSMLPCIEGDCEKLEQMIVNLLDNAIRFSSEQGNITIAVNVDKNMLFVQIIAQRVNITTDFLSPSFQQLSWLNNGTGLGLHLAKRIVEAHGGQIWVENNPNKGSIFNFAIPVKLRLIEQTKRRKKVVAKEAPACKTIGEKAGKHNSKRRPMNLKDKSLLLRLDDSEWDNFMSVSNQLGVTPSLLARSLIRQTISRYSRDGKLDDLFRLFTNPAPATTPLSHREMEILNLMAQGITNREIGEILEVGEKTVKNHITSILRKLEANSRTHAVVLALKHNLVRQASDEYLQASR